jgi:drug/metabolite transporter (DMT)-like permease
MIAEADHPTQSSPATAQVLAGMGVAMIALAFSSIFIIKLEHASVPAAVIAFYRMALAAALIIPVAIVVKRREIVVPGRREAALLLLGGFFLAAHFGAWISSLAYIPIATSVVLVNSHPLLVAIASYVFLGERPSRGSAIGTVLGLLGMAIISGAGFRQVEFALVGDGLAILGALAVVGYFIVGRKIRARVSVLGYVAPLYAVCAAFLLIWILAGGYPLYPYGSEAWFYFAALAVVPTILGHSIFNWAIKHVRPSAVSIAFLGEPVIASILGLIFLEQRPPSSTLMGGPLILAGIYLATASGHRAPANESAE